MWKTNLKILLTVLLTLGAYTAISNVIPQVESQVPERVEIGPDVSIDQLVSMGEEIYQGPGGCEACHGLGTRAPSLLGEIGGRCGERVEGMTCKEYLHESLTEPNEYVVEGFQPIMPAMGAQLSGGQIWALVAFLQSQGGEVTVTSEDLEGAAAGSPGTGGGEAAGGDDGGAGGSGPRALVKSYGCLSCHQLGGTGGVTAPPFEAIRDRGFSREYLRRSILEPNADTASGYAEDYSQFAGTMLANFDERMSGEEIDALVDWLAGDDEDGGEDAAGDESGTGDENGTGAGGSP
jgi:mono/diheme cytochrome c family protein